MAICEKLLEWLESGKDIRFVGFPPLILLALVWIDKVDLK